MSLLFVPPVGFAAMTNTIDVTLQVVDEKGAPIPYATIWGYIAPRANPLAIDHDDLWRLTNRYQTSFELALDVESNRPVSYLKVFPMSDKSGVLRRTIDYRHEEGSASNRPEKLVLGFAVMKKGYLPARVDIPVTQESGVTERIVLEKDPSTMADSKPYLQDFERLRFELSDPHLNEEISIENKRRIDRLHEELKATAQRALDAGDRVGAARIYARMQYLPSIRTSNGKAIGFSQADPWSAESYGYLKKAYSLDPNNSYIAAKYLFRQGADQFGGNKYALEKASDAQRRDFVAYLDALRSFMRAKGPEVWPSFHQLYAFWLRKSPSAADRDQALSLLEELYRSEPKFQTREKLLNLH
jgi:hypothetical protein